LFFDALVSAAAPAVVCLLQFVNDIVIVVDATIVVVDGL